MFSPEIKDKTNSISGGTKTPISQLWQRLYELPSDFGGVGVSPTDNAAQHSPIIGRTVRIGSIRSMEEAHHLRGKPL